MTKMVTIVPKINVMGYKRGKPYTLPEDVALDLLDTGQVRLLDEDYTVEPVEPVDIGAGGQVGSTVVGGDDDLLDELSTDGTEIEGSVYSSVLDIEPDPEPEKPRQSRRRRAL